VKQATIFRLAMLRSTLNSIQLLVILLILAHWLQIASGIPSIRHILVAMQSAGEVLGELLIVAAALGIPIFFSIMLSIGSRLIDFSNASQMLPQIATQQLIGACMRVPLMLTLLRAS
jgi:hypothetical protein